MPYLISLIGPTAAGKTALSVRLAKALNAPIVSADSVQIYQGLDIGSGKVTQEEMEGVHHYMLDILSPEQEFNAGEYGRQVEGLLKELFAEQEVVLLVGGAGFYFQAVWQGFDEIPAIDAEIRLKLNVELAENGLESLLDELKTADLVTWQQMDRNNHVRVVRALEVWRGTGKPISYFRGKKATQQNPWIDLKIGLEWERQALYRRIEARVDVMLEAGWLEETRQIAEQFGMDCKGLTTLGYRELAQFIKGEMDPKAIGWEATVALIKQNTRRYAKRQTTWFKRDAEITWFSQEQLEEILPWIQARIAP
jgi:tRNA dimethylallyltransferase